MKVLKLLLYFVITTLLLAALPFSGIFMPLIFILSSALLVAISVKWNVMYSVFSAAFSIVFVFLMLDSSSFSTVAISAVSPVVSFICSVGIYIALKSKADLRTTLLAGTLGYFGLIAVVYFLYGSTFFADVLSIAKDYMLESIDSVMPAIPPESASAVNEIKKMYELYFENLKVIAPAIILSLFFILSYLSIKVSSHFAKNDPAFNNIPPFSEIHAPAFLLIIAAISYFCQLTSSPFISGLAANVFLALSVYYTLCGFSVIDFFLKLRIKSLAARLGIMIAGVLVLTVVSIGFYFANPVLITMFGGIIDSVVNYRAKIRFLNGK